MRGDQSRLQGTARGQKEEEEEDESTTCIRNGKSVRQADVIEANSASRLSLTPGIKVPSMNQQHKLACSSSKSKNIICSVSHPCPPVHSCPTQSTPSHPCRSSVTRNGLRLSPCPALQSSPEDSFNSSFSFIQQSLNSSQKTVTTTSPAHEQEPLNPLKSTNVPEPKADTTSSELYSLKQSTPVHSPASLAPGNQVQKEELSLGGKFWREQRWGGKEETSHLPDCESRSLDIEVTSSLSVDSDTASASSYTSGYESATPGSEQGWDNLVKMYEGVLQDRLQNNRTYTKVSLMESSCGNGTWPQL